MPARSYVASGQSNPGAMFRLTMACLGAALIGGLVEGFVSQWVSLLLLFPLLLGGVVGFVAKKVIASTHIRAPWAAVTIAAAAGLIAQMTVYGVQYEKFRSELRTDIQAEAQPAGPIEQTLDDALESSTGHRGFVAYLVLRARTGTEIKHNGNGSGLKLSGIGFWLLFAVNLLLAAGIAASQAWEGANAPYCEQCHRFYDRHAPVASGAADAKTLRAVRETLDQGGLESLPTTIGSPQPGAMAALSLLRCSGCTDHEPQLTLTAIVGNQRKNTTKVAYKTMLRADEGQRLEKAFAAATPPS